jgi:hypothetical protein
MDIWTKDLMTIFPYRGGVQAAQFEGCVGLVSDEFRFKVWSAGNNKHVQRNYSELFKERILRGRHLILSMNLNISYPNIKPPSLGIP